MFEAKFQSFHEKTDPSKGKERLKALRAELEKRKLDGFIIPRTDQHQNEYVPAGEERLAWLTGFSGSAGVAVVLKDRAALFVDGRYTLEAKAQVDETAFKVEHWVELPPEDGLDYVDNARIKARHGRLVGSSDRWMLADDSGIELVALGGGPGVQTARWAEGRHVERALAAVEGNDRSARYVCELVSIAPDGREARFPRAMCRFTTDDGRTGTGWTEFNWPEGFPA